jgi:hypothetical protein
MNRIEPVRGKRNDTHGERYFFARQLKQLKHSSPLPFPVKEQLLLARASLMRSGLSPFPSASVGSVCVVVPQLPLPLLLPLWSGARGSTGQRLRATALGETTPTELTDTNGKSVRSDPCSVRTLRLGSGTFLVGSGSSCRDAPPLPFPVKKLVDVAPAQRGRERGSSTP